jgi:hypothetical protein
MRFSHPARRPRHLVGGATGTSTAGLCPRMLWRARNPALPPPDSLTCLTRGPDCCATSAVVDVRRIA